MTTRSRSAAAALVVVLAALAMTAALGGGEPASGAGSARASDARAGGKPNQPNIVVVMTDDQTVESMRVMPKVQKLIGDEGVTFDNNFAANPICCPSRSTFLSGQYSHNTGVLRNSVPDGGFASFDNSETLPLWLQRAGYYTGHIGKYLNGYGANDPTQVPPGWSEWYGAVDPTTYRMYGYTLNENGNLVTYGDYDTPDPATYQTDVYAKKAEDFIKRRAPAKAPFYLSVAPLAPHVEVFKREAAGDDDPPTPTFPNPRPAPRDAGAFKSEGLPRNPDFNEADVSDKPATIRNRPLLSPQATGMARNRYRSRLGSLLAVDDMVGRIVKTLRGTGELNDTVILFLSDNGFFLGEHRIPNGKQFPYETSIRVPLEIRGPGIPKDQVREQMAANVDLAPTILKLAHASAGGPIDGRSLLPLIRNPDLYPGRGIVLENWCQTDESCFDPANPQTPRYRGVRTDRYAYMRYPDGEQELYDLDRDPYELNSLQNSAKYKPQLAALSKLLDQLQFCRTEGCRVSPKLTLKASYKRGRLGGGKPCTKSGVTLRVGGGDAGDAVSARFLVPGAKDATDSKRPLRALVPKRQLSGGRKTKLSANVSVLDGRIETVRASVPRSC
jgi:arylsulfatase A-like enzyme